MLLLPADHHVRDETALAQSLRQATSVRCRGAATPSSCWASRPTNPTPSSATSCRPASGRHNVGAGAAIRREARVETGARAARPRSAVEVFIIAATARALLALYGNGLPNGDGHASRRWKATAARRPDPAAAAVMYRRLPSVDFSRDVLEGQEAALRVVPVPRAAGPISARRSGWPRPCAVCPGSALASPMPANASYLNLAVQHRRLRVGGAPQSMQGALQ